MWIPQLNRHLYVCGLNDVLPIAKRDPRFWNIISIREPTMQKSVFALTKSTLYLTFDDIENPDARDGFRPARQEDLERIFAFVDGIPGQPVLIHCLLGISRSTAVILVLLIQGCLQQGQEDFVDLVIDQLLALRPQAGPNALVLRIGLKLLMSDTAAEDLIQTLLNHPQLLDNRRQFRAMP